MTPLETFGFLDEATLLKHARTAFLEACATERRSSLTAHTLDTRGEVHFGDAVLHALAQVSPDRLERVFVSGDAKAVLWVNVGVIHGRDDDVDASTAGFELTCGPLHVVKRDGQPLCVDGSPAMRSRMAMLLKQHVLPMLTPTTPPATPLDWVHRTRSCEFERRHPFDGGAVKLVVAEYSPRTFGGLVTDDLHYAPLGWMPRVDAPVRSEARVCHTATAPLADLASFAAALGLASPAVLHREWYVTDPSTRARGFYFDGVDLTVPRGEVDAAYGRAGSWRLRIARRTAPDGLRRWSFIAQDEGCAGLVRGRAELISGDANGLRVTVRSHADHGLADALLAALDAKVST
ncbi:MAG: hypothetical protein U0326_40160 [Polyangiales bacterium]